MCKVTLITHTPEPDKVVAAAAKLCYSKIGVNKILDNLTDEKVQSFVNMLMDLGHESPIEHVSFTFGIENVSRVLSHQLVRHRIGCSYSQQSQRYVELEQFDYIVPQMIKDNQEAYNIFVKMMEEDQKAYNELTKILIEEHLKIFEAQGKNILDKEVYKAAKKAAIEDARYVLPNACETKLVVTMNARALYNLFSQRCCNRAQWEIRDMADQMLFEVRRVAPVLFKNAGPKCLTGPCPEGSMSCGKMKEMKEKYGRPN